jgi:PilZ domain
MTSLHGKPGDSTIDSPFPSGNLNDAAVDFQGAFGMISAMPDEGIQRRRYPRYPTSLEATVYTASGALQAHIAQISRGGCLIFPPLPPQPSPQIKLTFRLAGDGAYVNCKAEIVYTIMDKGSGIAFTEISEHNRELITEFFEKQPVGKPSSTP